MTPARTSGGSVAGLTRRELLGLLSAGVVGIYATGCSQADSGDDASAMFWDPESVARIGRMVDRSDELVRAAVSELEERLANSQLDAATAGQLAMSDFEQGRSVVVDRWAMSATEAALAVLVSDELD